MSKPTTRPSLLGGHLTDTLKLFIGQSNVAGIFLHAALRDKIEELIGDTIPYGKNLKPVACGQDYWRRRRCIEWAQELIDYALFLGLQGDWEGEGRFQALVDDANDFLEFQKERYFGSLPECVAEHCRQHLEEIGR